jgi:TolB protein
LEIPFDSTLLPDDSKPGQVFLSYYDEGKKEWIYAGGKVDINRGVVILNITHASWWAPTTWNWGAWIAVLNKFLRISIVDWIEAVQLLTDDCPQVGTYVQVDSSQALNVVQGCIEQDDVERPELRVVNPKSFFFEIRPIAGGNGYPAQALLSPGEDVQFEASTFDPSPLTIEAQITEKSGWYLVVHMVITMLPGANQFGIQGHHVACITERLADVSYFASAAESLIVDQNGAAAAENISEFMLDGDAVQRFITAADDCNFGPSPTWSIEGIKQIGGAVSTIMSATDYIANYFAGNTNAQVSFMWASPIPTQTPIPPIVIQEKGIVFELDDEIYVMNADGTNLTRLTNNSVPDWDPAWSLSGDRIAFSSKIDGNSFDLYIMNADGSNIQRLTSLPNEEWDAAWSPNGQQIAFTYGQINSSTSEIYIINADESGLALLTEGGHPTWSPDGKQIAFRRNVEILVMNADGSDIRTLTSQLPSMFPIWSPNSQQIVFQAINNGNPEIYIINADGSGQTNLSNNPAADTIPTWSPEGRRIAFVSNRNGTQEIFVMNVDGSDVKPLSRGYEPDW